MRSNEAGGGGVGYVLVAGDQRHAPLRQDEGARGLSGPSRYLYETVASPGTVWMSTVPLWKELRGPARNMSVGD